MVLSMIEAERSEAEYLDKIETENRRERATLGRATGVSKGKRRTIILTLDEPDRNGPTGRRFLFF